jgi:hypothetical protein
MKMGQKEKCFGFHLGVIGIFHKNLQLEGSTMLGFMQMGSHRHHVVNL